MAVVKKKKITWIADPDSKDIVSHNVYCDKATQDLDYNSTYVNVAMPKTEVILPDEFPPGFFDADTNYKVGISAIDDVGNESSIVSVQAPFDFVAPGAPSGIKVVNV